MLYVYQINSPIHREKDEKTHGFLIISLFHVDFLFEMFLIW